MIFKKTLIKDLIIIKPTKFKDKRGFFYRNYCEKKFKKQNLKFKIMQCNVSHNLKKGTLRGFHYSNEMHDEKKIMSCLNGEIFLSVVDIRKKSSSYLKIFNILLNKNNKFSVLVPAGCANATLSTKDNTVVQYYMNSGYDKKVQRAFNYKDPHLKIKWPIKPSIISKKDSKSKNFI